MADSLYKKSVIQEESSLKDNPNTIHFGVRFYSIFRVDRKFYSLGSLGSFEKYMQREFRLPNSNPNIQNEIIIGEKDIRDHVEFYIKDCKLRKDNVIARDILLTSTHGFYNMPDTEVKKWVDLQKTWLEKEFGDNCLYAVLHKDEFTYHIHALIVPKFENDKGQQILSNKRYFGGKVALSNWQTKYAESMQSTFKQLNRGIKFSKAKHIEIKHFYSMINQEINEKDLKQVVARSVNADLLEIKLKALNKTLETYKQYWRKSDLEKNDFKLKNTLLGEQLKKLKKDKALYKESIEMLAQIHKIPQNAVKEVVKFIEKELTIEEPVKKKVIELERER